MRITPKFIIQVVAVALLTVVAFPLLLAHHAKAVTSTTWGKIKQIYRDGAPPDSTPPPPPPPPPPPKD